MAPRVLRAKSKVAPVIDKIPVVTNKKQKNNKETVKQVNNENGNMENGDTTKDIVEKTKQGKNKKLNSVENMELVSEVPENGDEGIQVTQQAKKKNRSKLNKETTSAESIAKVVMKTKKKNEIEAAKEERQGRNKKVIIKSMEAENEIVKDNNGEGEIECNKLEKVENLQASKIKADIQETKNKHKKVLSTETKLNENDLPDDSLQDTNPKKNIVKEPQSRKNKQKDLTENKIDKKNKNNIQTENNSLKVNKNDKKERKEKINTEIGMHTKSEIIKNDNAIEPNNILLKTDVKDKKTRKQKNIEQDVEVDKEINKSDNKSLKENSVKGKGRKQKDSKQNTNGNDELKEKDTESFKNVKDKGKKKEITLKLIEPLQHQENNDGDSEKMLNKKSKLNKKQENKSENKNISSKVEHDETTNDVKSNIDINAKESGSEEEITNEIEKPKSKKRGLKTQKHSDEPIDKKQKLGEKGSKDKKAPLKNKSETNYEDLDFTNSTKSTRGDEWNFKIANWNVDGIRAWINKGGLNYIKNEKPDIICLQEVKCLKEKLPEETNIPGYHSYWLCSDSSGYAGVGIYTAKLAINVQYGLNNDEIDNEGRVITAEYEQFYLISTYVPNAGRKLVTLPKRLKWNEVFRKHVMNLDEKKPVIICGDMNVAHNEIDLANPKGNKKNAGFTVEERAGMTELLGDGFIDTFRHLNPDKKGAYTFWTYMMNSRAKNVGWRLDYFIISKRLLPSLCDSVIRDQVYGSDHCPIALFLHLTSAEKPK